MYRLVSPLLAARNAMQLSKMIRVDGSEGVIGKSYLVHGFDYIYELRIISGTPINIHTERLGLLLHMHLSLEFTISPGGEEGTATSIPVPRSWAPNGSGLIIVLACTCTCYTCSYPRMSGKSDCSCRCTKHLHCSNLSV